MSKYLCDKCNYATDNKFNYNKHLNTVVHKRQTGKQDVCKYRFGGDNFWESGDKSSSCTVQNSILSEDTPNDDNLDQIDDSKNKLCEYCYKPIKYENHRARHYRGCKEKKRIDRDNIIKQLKLDKKIAEQKAEEAIKIKKNIEKDYQKMINKMNSTESTSHTTINNIDKRRMNIYYVVNNYTEAENYEDVMAKKLSKAEKEQILQFGPSAGCENIIINRCVTGLSKDKRPIHCLDASRDKFIYKTKGNWKVDLHATKIMKPAMAHVRTLYDISDNNPDMDNRIKSIKSLIDMDKNAGKRTVRNLKKLILLTNDE